MSNLRTLDIRCCAAALALLLALGGCGGSAGEARSIASPAGPGSLVPHLARGPDGTVVLSWVETDAGASALRYAVLDSDRWLPPQTVARGTDWFVNWADFPSVTPVSAESWAAHWLVKRPGGAYAYDIALAASEDGGRSWGRPITPHGDGTATEHGFVSLFPAAAGIGAIWLDGRNMAENGSGHGAGGMTLRSAVVTPTGQLEEQALIDELVCDCCQTDVALTSNGPVAVYRNRTPAEIRDIYLARFRAGQWQPGRPVADDGWTITGCPVNGPAVDAREEAVVVAWFTGAQEQPRVRLARSGDAGATFAAPVDVDTDSTVGRVDVALLADGSAVVSWLRQAAVGRGEVVVRRVTADGALGRVLVVAETGTSRPAGFPQMLSLDGELLFAWTDLEDDRSRVLTGLVDPHRL